MKKRVCFMIFAALLLVTLVPPETRTSAVGGVIAFGDSNTSGSYLPKEFPSYADHNWPTLTGVINAGVSGNTSSICHETIQDRCIRSQSLDGCHYVRY